MNYQHQHQQQPYWPNSIPGHYGYPVIVTSSGTPNTPLPASYPQQYPHPPPQPQFLCASPVYYCPQQMAPSSAPSPPPDSHRRRSSHRLSSVSSNSNSSNNVDPRKSRRPMSAQAAPLQHRMASIAEERESQYQHQKRGAPSFPCVTPADKDEEIPLAMLAYRKGYPPLQQRSTAQQHHLRPAPAHHSSPSNLSIRSAPAATPRPRRSARMETSSSTHTSIRRPSLVSDRGPSNLSVTSSEPSSSSAAAPATPPVSRQSVAKRWINRFSRSLKS